MKITRYSAIIFLSLVILGCVGCGSDFSLVPEYEKATELYYGKDMSAGEAALSTFLARAEKNIESAKQDRKGDYRALLGMAWLRLASIHKIAGDTAKSDQALTSAIVYFDQVPRFASDARYQQNKKDSLWNFLDQAESESRPVWRMAEGGGKGS